MRLAGQGDGRDRARRKKSSMASLFRRGFQLAHSSDPSFRIVGRNNDRLRALSLRFLHPRNVETFERLDRFRCRVLHPLKDNQSIPRRHNAIVKDGEATSSGNCFPEFGKTMIAKAFHALRVLLGSFSDPGIVNDPPYVAGRSRHVDVGYAQMSERIDDRVDDGSRCPDRAKLAAAFHTKRIMCARRAERFGMHHRDIVSARHTIIHEGPRQQLAGYVIIDAGFAECLADTLHESAVDLPLDDHRIDNGTDVIHRDVVHERHDTCLRINLDLRDMCPTGEREVYRIVERLLLEPRLQDFKWVVDRKMSRQRNLLKALSPISTRDAEHTRSELDVALAGFQHPPRAPRRIAIREGARPQASAKVQTPIPRYFPRRSDSAFRFENPLQSATTSTFSRQLSGSPLSYSTRTGVL